MSQPFDTSIVYCQYCDKPFNSDEQEDCPYCAPKCKDCRGKITEQEIKSYSGICRCCASHKYREDYDDL